MFFNKIYLLKKCCNSDDIAMAQLNLKSTLIEQQRKDKYLKI